MPAVGDTQTTVVMVVDDGSEVACGHLEDRRPDLATVDALMRLQLSAKRRGWRVGVRGASDELRGLLELVGLGDVLVLEPRGQAEVVEELGRDEVVQPRDLRA
ncbi:hypothetical protein DSM112329_01692 [Paraconexibacter sp. AEG42_29]|uniref:MlaB-like STAS domain-containing protein n=1 Tax=Paraconexibacter sp. AEG42_29 TaxID=2997339 RepID=A0AAU7AU33_9ACTN